MSCWNLTPFEFVSPKNVEGGNENSHSHNHFTNFWTSHVAPDHIAAFAVFMVYYTVWSKFSAYPAAHIDTSSVTKKLKQWKNRDLGKLKCVNEFYLQIIFFNIICRCNSLIHFKVWLVLAWRNKTIVIAPGVLFIVCCGVGSLFLKLSKMSKNNP